MYVCMYVCTYACMYVHMYVCICNFALSFGTNGFYFCIPCTDSSILLLPRETNGAAPHDVRMSAIMALIISQTVLGERGRGGGGRAT